MIIIIIIFGLIHHQHHHGNILDCNQTIDLLRVNQRLQAIAKRVNTAIASIQIERRHSDIALELPPKERRQVKLWEVVLWSFAVRTGETTPVQTCTQHHHHQHHHQHHTTTPPPPPSPPRPHPREAKFFGKRVGVAGLFVLSVAHANARHRTDSFAALLFFLQALDKTQVGQLADRVFKSIILFHTNAPSICHMYLFLQHLQPDVFEKC